MTEMIARAARRHRGMPQAVRKAERHGALGLNIIASGLVMIIVLLWGQCTLAAEPRVVLLRGWFGVFSTGMDGLASELKAKGIKAEVAGHLYWSTAVKEILKERAAGKAGSLVLVGHSQGANNVIDMARSLEAQKVSVDLLVTLAPFMQNPVPANVVHAINYYQSPGWGAPLTTDSGFNGKLANIDVGSDWTIAHISIDKSARVHADILREIAALTRAKERPEDLSANPLTAAAPPQSSERRFPSEAQAQ